MTNEFFEEIKAGLEDVLAVSAEAARLATSRLCHEPEDNPWRETVRDIFDATYFVEGDREQLSQVIHKIIRKRHEDYFWKHGYTFEGWRLEEEMDAAKGGL